jgi:hypothetical protein
MAVSVKTRHPPAPTAQSNLGSSRYGFSVTAGFPKGETWRYVQSVSPLFSLLIFFGDFRIARAFSTEAYVITDS